MNGLAEKVALVTGASRGMGQATADELAAAGAHVYCAQRGQSGHNDIAADFSMIDTPDRVIDTVIEQAGRLDILVNNAGIMREGRVEESSLEDWEAQLRINLTVPFLLIRAAMPWLRATKGTIVNVGSIEGLASNPNRKTG